MDEKDTKDHLNYAALSLTAYTLTLHLYHGTITRDPSGLVKFALLLSLIYCSFFFLLLLLQLRKT